MKKKLIFIALIPAKKKSDGLKNKNFKKLNGIPLFEIAIKSALRSKLIHSTFVTSDSKEILSKSSRLGCNIIKRPTSLCQKNTKANTVIYNDVNFIEKEFDLKDCVLVYLQPTSPLRNYLHVDKSIALFKKKNVRSLISICKAEKSIYKSFKLKNEKVISFFNEKFVTSNRQALPRIYFPNGAIYIFYIKDF